MNICENCDGFIPFIYGRGRCTNSGNTKWCTDYCDMWNPGRGIWYSIKEIRPPDYKVIAVAARGWGSLMGLYRAETDDVETRSKTRYALSWFDYWMILPELPKEKKE